MHREGAWAPGGDSELARRQLSTDWAHVAAEAGGLGALTVAAAALGTLVSAPLPAAVAMLLVGGVGLLSRRKDDRQLEGRERALELREEFGIGPAWTVDLMVRQGEAPTGRDQGLIWIEGGCMMFSGLRTSFSLSPEQVGGSVTHDEPIAGLRLRLNLDLARETSAGPLSLSFWPIAEGTLLEQSNASDLRFALGSVLIERRWGTKEGSVGQWPPVGPGPGAPTPRELRRAALVRNVGWTGAAAWVGVCVALDSPLAGLVVFVVAAIGSNLAILRSNAIRWQAYRDAKRVWGEP